MTATGPTPEPNPLLDALRGRAGRSVRLLGHWLVRAGLILLALSVLMLPFYVASQYYLEQKYVSKQASPPVTHIDATAAATASRLSLELPAATAPVVLTYHDVNSGNPSKYVVTPAAFDAQMAALKKAGYRSLTSQEFVNYLKGGPAPPRSVFITFDDGPRGLWSNADRILARHHLHGSVFLITSRVDDRPYYLSWREIGRMAGSGRWDFQAHTHDLHHRAPTDAAGHHGSALSNRLWLNDRHRLETRSEYQARVSADIRTNIDKFRSHGLPTPQLFAYPFSEASERGNLPTGSTLRSLLSKHYAATLSNKSPDPLGPPVAASRRAAADRTVQRLEVTDSTTPDELLSDVAEWTQRPPVASSPLTEPALWTRDDGTGGRGIDVFTGRRPFAGTDHYAAAVYRPLGSVDWTDYRVDATITGLANGTNQAAVSVRNRTRNLVVISVSQDTATLEHGGRKVVVRKLAQKSSHTLRVSVRGATTTARVDGTTELSWVAENVPATELTGGFGIRVGSNRTGAAPPAFSELHLSPLPQKTPTAAVTRQTVTESAPLAPNAYWQSAPGVRAPFQIKDGAITPLGRVALSSLGAYEPARTQEWTDYTTSGTISKLYDSGVKGAIQVRVGSPQVISVQVSHSRLEVLSGNADSQSLVGARDLKAADSHQVSVTVTGRSTVIRVDGTVRMTLPAEGEAGGVAYAAYRDATRLSWPPLAGLKVVPVAGG
ncbi:biofilm PGA synthesis lipoprotein PgaB [Streptomyces sp. SAI-117]|uniref:polysaccharide deacetylase family protein n=1 Tax=unclassified Streptomyces TaxID=2593676 RepID=UPI002473D1C5|nr:MULTISPECIES: polysaccharide deacetylase family protein [unclassified Streptomyces]MDH6547291.1 biofilm PGA synthesis lipoprotein PgaB [Streptomyces sp. SAI-041]MDH6566372.1 biofilm PGA synthesis lipoprotein PgaB [Streptomyces sp. SAI-117]